MLYIKKMGDIPARGLGNFLFKSPFITDNSDIICGWATANWMSVSDTSPVYN